MTDPIGVEVCTHRGCPRLCVDGRPLSLAGYSPVSWRRDLFQENLASWAQTHASVYFISIPRPKTMRVWGESAFWDGNSVSDAPQVEIDVSMDEQVEAILRVNPDACFIVRNGPTAPPTWVSANPDECFHTEHGDRLDVPSVASAAWWRLCGETSKALVRYTERHEWAARRVLGYWYGLEGEGTHPALFEGWLYDHSPAMTARWQAFLQERYGTVDALRTAYDNPSITFESASVPQYRLPDTEAYWQAGDDNRALRDYLLLQKKLLHDGIGVIAKANTEATDRKRVFLMDGFKQTMQGWHNHGFFNPETPWPNAYPDTLAGSGSLGMAECMQLPGLDGIITPHDYQDRGIGGIFEPEGIVDSAVLRQRAFLCEMDIRTWSDDREHGAYGMAGDAREFAAINWRNVATAIARGFDVYWMDLLGNWYGDELIQREIQRSIDALHASMEWEHQTVPGIAVIVDDQCALETNGDGRFLNEAMLWELRNGIARCGVPYRVYLLDDLSLHTFPEHRLFYFPNLFRVDEDRLKLLEKTVLRDGHVVVWGPGSGISDGDSLSSRYASRLTGFDFELASSSMPRRVRVTNFEHPVTSGLPADCAYGSAIAYGPCLYPTDGISLGAAWGKQARCRSGLSIKSPGTGNAAWTSLFTAASGFPADLWRSLARYAGAHVYCESNDVLIAGGEVVALHSVKSGPKTIRLPGAYAITDLRSGAELSRESDEICFVLKAPDTQIFHITEPD